MIVLWNYEERSTFPYESSCVRLNSHWLEDARFCLSWLLYLLCCVWPHCPICLPSGLKGGGEGCIWAAPHRWWSLRWCISSDLSYCQITAAGRDLRTLKDLHKMLICGYHWLLWNKQNKPKGLETCDKLQQFKENSLIGKLRRGSDEQ